MAEVLYVSNQVFNVQLHFFPGTCDIGAFGAYDRKQFTFKSKNNCEGN